MKGMALVGTREAFGSRSTDPESLLRMQIKYRKLAVTRDRLNL